MLSSLSKEVRREFYDLFTSLEKGSVVIILGINLQKREKIIFLEARY
jgi:hypothetical protein